MSELFEPRNVGILGASVSEKLEHTDHLPQLQKKTVQVTALGPELLVWPVQEEPK